MLEQVKLGEGEFRSSYDLIDVDFLISGPSIFIVSNRPYWVVWAVHCLNKILYILDIIKFNF